MILTMSIDLFWGQFSFLRALRGGATEFGSGSQSSKARMRTHQRFQVFLDLNYFMEPQEMIFIVFFCCCYWSYGPPRWGSRGRRRIGSNSIVFFRVFLVWRFPWFGSRGCAGGCGPSLQSSGWKPTVRQVPWIQRSLLSFRGSWNVSRKVPLFIVRLGVHRVLALDASPLFLLFRRPAGGHLRRWPQRSSASSGLPRHLAAG